MAWAAAIGAGSQLGSSIIAANQQSDARKQALDLINQSIADLQAVGVPSEQAMQISLEKYRSAGVLTPELEQAITQGDTELKGIETDPRLADAQMDALDSLRNLGQGGFNLQDKASLQKGLDTSNAVEKGNRDAILQDMAQKGALTGGGTLAAELLNQQGGATRGNQAALDTANQGYQRELAALAQSGQLAGQMQQTQFGQKAQVASAQDVINQMNTQAQQGVQTRNVAAQNNAQQTNLGNAQNIMNANTGLSNQQEMYNKQLPQQQYQDQLAKAQAMAGARSGAAQTTLVGGQQAAQNTAALGAGLGQAGLSYANYANQQANATKKKDDEEQY